jgi:iron complex outermembrane receptor protein
VTSNAYLRTSSIALVAVFIAQPVMAQTAPAQQTPPTRGEIDDDVHNRRAGEDSIVVTAPGLERLDVLAGTSVVEGDELQRNMSGQLGDVLESVPGVTSSSFAPGAARPVLRGFSGERVRVLFDGIGAIDASNTSDDHAVSIDPLTAERIEVLRGPAVLLYGSQAIGGAVNVIDKRIPRREPIDKIHIDGLASYDTVNEQYSLGGSLDAALGGGFVFHADGSYRDANDLRIPGYVVSDSLRAELLADAVEEEGEGELEEAAELRDIANQRDILPNSFARAWSANAGLAFFRGDSNMGVSVGWYDTTYGVPERPGAGHHHHEGEEGHDGEEHEGEEEEGGVSIGLKQFRADFRGEYVFGGSFIDRMLTRVGYSDYTHTEFEGSEVGTVFDITGIEARAEFVQAPRGALRGSFGAQYYFRDFAAVGEEAFVAPNETEQLGLFALQEFGDGPFEIEGAIRYEKTNVESAPLKVRRDFDAFSGALGASFQTAGGLRFGVNGSRVSRAPAGEELFANGPHIATQAFEVGDPNLEMERAWGVEGYMRGTVGPAQVSIAVFKNWFDNFIYLEETGEEEDDLPVFAYLQDDATYFGVEGEVTAPLFSFGTGSRVVGEARGEYVRAKLDDGTPLPRIPPLGLSGALQLETTAFDVRGEVEWFAKQNRIAPFETPTNDFAFVNASIAWRPFDGQRNITLMAGVDNIFDTEGRRHTGFTKDFVPLPGRNFKISLRTSL